MEDKEGGAIRWNKKDVHRVESFNQRDGDNHLPKTERYADAPTWKFYERYIHILEGDTDFDFLDFEPGELKQIDWQELKIVTQKMKGEEPEEYDGSVSLTSKQNLNNMKYVRNFLVWNFGKDFDLPDPDSLK